MSKAATASTAFASVAGSLNMVPMVRYTSGWSAAPSGSVTSRIGLGDVVSNRPQQLPVRDMFRRIRLEARRVDVEVQVVVTAGERSGIEPHRSPQRLDLLARGLDPVPGRERTERLDDIRNADESGDDRPGELGCVMDDEVWLPSARDRDKVGEHRRRGNRTEHLCEHQVGDLVGRQHAGLRVLLPELSCPGLGRHAGGCGRKPGILHPAADIVRSGPQDVGGHVHEWHVRAAPSG